MATSGQKTKDLWHIYNHEMLSRGLRHVNLLNLIFQMGKQEVIMKATCPGFPRRHVTHIGQQSSGFGLSVFLRLWSSKRRGWSRFLSGEGIPLGRGVLWLRGMSQGYREDRQGPTLSVRDRGGASDQRPLLFTRPWNSSQALANKPETKKHNSTFRSKAF